MIRARFLALQLAIPLLFINFVSRANFTSDQYFSASKVAELAGEDGIADMDQDFWAVTNHLDFKAARI